MSRGPSAEIVETIVVAQSGFARLTRNNVRYHRRDGRTQEIVREAYDHGDGAAALLHDPAADTVVLVRQWRFGAHVRAASPAGGMLVEVPAGLVEGRDPEQAVRAELEEETGIQPVTLRHVLGCYMSPGSLTEWVDLFLGTYDRGANRRPGGGIVAEGEDIEVIEPTRADAMRMMSRGEIQDAKTAILLLMLFSGRVT